MTIKIEKAICGPDWLVTLDDYPVVFRSKDEATAFVERLRARLEAPHVIPVY